jgi:hypothetical protein
MDKNKLQKLIKTTLQEHNLKTKSCSCGCNTCGDKNTSAPILNESIAPRTILSEGLKYHIDNNKPLTEHVYRAGSQNYFNLWAEARALYSRGILEIQNEDDLEILTETNLGEFGILEDGTRVPLDFPMEEEIKKNKQYYKNIALLDKKGLAKKQFSDKDIQIAKKMLSRGEFNLDESKNKSKDKPIGKPMRGGPKKFYVYVRDPKTKKVKKVTFGDSGGLKTKINDPKARKAFAARHKCGQGEEKTSPKWWSCRIPRFAKLLGLKSNFTGFW